MSVNESISDSSRSNNSEDSGIKVTKSIAYGCLILLSIMGNSFIVWAVKRDNRLQTTTNLLIRNLSISDLINSLLVPPARMYETIYGGTWLWASSSGTVICKFAYFIPSAIGVVSAFSCTLISVDRYLAVARPIQGGFSKFRIKYVILGVWIFALTLSLPYLYVMKVVTMNNKKYCFYNEDLMLTLFYICFFVTSYLLPMIVITITYSLIVYKLSHHKVPGQQNEVIRRRRKDQNKKVFKMSAAIVGLFYFTFLWVGIVISVIHQARFSSELFFIASFMLSLCCSSNFVISLIFNDFYRQNFKAIFRRCQCCKVAVVNPPRVEHNKGVSLQHLAISSLER